MSSLRDELIEELYLYVRNHEGETDLSLTNQALDAILDKLEERQQEWDDAAFAVEKTWSPGDPPLLIIGPAHFVAALRVQPGDEK